MSAWHAMEAAAIAATLIGTHLVAYFRGKGAGFAHARSIYSRHIKSNAS